MSIGRTSAWQCDVRRSVNGNESMAFEVANSNENSAKETQNGDKLEVRETHRAYPSFLSPSISSVRAMDSGPFLVSRKCAVQVRWRNR